MATQIFLIWCASASFSKVSDLPEYYAVSKLVLSGHGVDTYSLQQQVATEQAYFPELNGRVIGFFVPPFALPWVVPVGLIPVEIVRYVWKALLVASLGLSVWMTARLFQLDKKGIFWLIAVTGFSGCVYEALRIDQLACFLLLAMMICIWALKKDRPAIAALSLAFLLLKPQEVLPFLVYLVGGKRYRVLLMFLGIAAAVALVGVLEIGGLPGLHNYQKLMSEAVENSSFLQSDLSPTLRGQLYRLLPQAKTISTIVSSGVLLMALAVILWAGRKFRLAAGWVEGGLLMLPLGLVSALYFFDYDLVILLPTLVVLMKDQLQDNIPPLILLSIIIGGLIFMVPFSIFIHYDYLLPGGVINPYFWALLVFGIWLVYFTFKQSREIDLWLES